MIKYMLAHSQGQLEKVFLYEISLGRGGGGDSISLVDPLQLHVLDSFHVKKSLL